MVLPDGSFCLPFFGARNVHRSVLRKHRTTVFNFYGNHLQEPHIFTYMYICRRLYDGRERVRERNSHCLFRTRRLQNKILIFFGNYILFNLRLAIYICLYKYFMLFFIIIIIHFIFFFSCGL